ncbi:MAG TPA: AMP-binding protein, partial [Acidimicrobiia bacterium]
ARTDQFLLGVPAAGRNAEASDRLIGLFINSMVIRLDLRGDPTFADLVARVRTAALGAMSHQELPFETLVENLARERVPGRTPVFQVMLDYVNTPAAALTLGSLDLDPVPIADEASVYDINLYLYDDATDIRAKWEYRSDLFDRPSIVRMSEALTAILGAAVTDTTQTLSKLPLVSPSDTIRINALGAGTATETPAIGSFLARIEENARERPDAIAVVSGDTVISYRELWDQTIRVSRRIESACAPDALVALVAGRSAQLVPALLGTIHSGRTVVMVDTGQPEHRLAAMFDQVKIGAIISGGDSIVADLMPGVPDIERMPVGEGRPDSTPVHDTEAVAYVVFTSGSTGAPRAVGIGRGALENFVDDSWQRYRPGSGDRVLQFASPGFDTLIEEVIPTLVGGATLVLRPSELFSTFAEFTIFVAENAITILDLPTAWWHAWVDDMIRTGAASVPECVRLVIIGGEAASSDRWRAWQRITAGRIRLVNTYGPSESTVVVATFEPPRDWSPTTPVIPIGRPIQNTRLLVVAENGGEVPPGVPGELVVAGAPVGDGYLENDGRDSSFEETESGKRYHTGDLARMSVDGSFEFLGRIDDQFKVNGVRIEPGEIEAALAGHQSVDEAVVLEADADGEREIVGHLVASSPIDEAELRDYLRNRLPAAMVPGRFQFHTTLPMTPSGKVDRAGMRSMSIETGAGTPEKKTDRPPTPTERRISRIWESVMPRSGIDLDADFFAVGGHSLLGVRLISHAADEFGVALPLRIIYEAPTIAAMAAWIDRELEATVSEVGTVHVR